MQQKDQREIDKRIPGVKDLPLTNDEIQGDPRLTTGTGTMSSGLAKPMTDADKTPGEIKELNLQTMYNLKKLRDKNKDTEHKLHPTDYTEMPTESVSKTGPFTDTKALEIFDDYLLYKDGRIKSKKTKKAISLNRDYVVINKVKYDKKELFDKYADFLKQ